MFRIACLLAAVGLMATQGAFSVLFAQSAAETRYEVLSPWAEVDPAPVRGISPRVKSLAGRKIGLFVNYKRAARPIAQSIEKRLESMYPDSEISFFYSLQWNVSEIETKNRDKFAAWARDKDAVIMSVGD